MLPPEFILLLDAVYAAKVAKRKKMRAILGASAKRQADKAIDKARRVK